MKFVQTNKNAGSVNNYFGRPLTPVEWVVRISAQCEGWSGLPHYRFFSTILNTHAIRNVLVLGVYRGRDLAFLKSIRPDLRITGVDLFADAACKDWPEHKSGLTWAQAGFGKPPSSQVALANLEVLGLSAGVELIQMEATFLLASHEETYDLIYIDTSHDEASVRETIALARLRAPLLCGDDYKDAQPLWGVKKAVNESFTKHQVHEGWIWSARSDDWRER